MIANIPDTEKKRIEGLPENMYGPGSTLIMTSRYVC